MKALRVLVAFERSGVVREAFRKLGHNAWSCDLKAAEDGSVHTVYHEWDGKRWEGALLERLIPSNPEPVIPMNDRGPTYGLIDL